MLVNLGDIDEGLIVALTDSFCQIMPHGGICVIQRLADKLIQLGATPADVIDNRNVYPEARSDLQADMLATLAQASSPAAIDLLLNQPRAWLTAIQNDDIDTDAILVRSARLDNLVIPPTVVLLGRSNVGKSTLTNLAIGRATSITADLPGTTRDWVAGLAELPTPLGELTLRWFDTPGLRISDDPIEQRAIELALRVINSADVLIALRDPQNVWPNTTSLSRSIDLWVCNKCDQLGESDIPRVVADKPIIHISALYDQGIDILANAIAQHLGLAAITDAELPWAFSDSLKKLLATGNTSELAQYALLDQ